MASPIEQIREKLGMTQVEFARKLGISLPTLRLMEQGVMRQSKVLFRALQRAGYNSIDVAQKHEAWRRRRRTAQTQAQAEVG